MASNAPFTSVAVCAYGPPGLGKSSDQVAAFPNAHFIAHPRAIMSARTVWGFVIPDNRITVAGNLKEAAAAAKKAMEQGLDVVVDDISPLAEYSERHYGTPTDKGGGGLKGFDIYKAATGDLMEMRKAAEFCNVMFACSAHLGQPRINKLNGRPIRGGPLLPGQMQELITSVFDTIVQIEADPSRKVGYPASYICRTTMDPSFAYKDRHDIANVLTVMPPNMRELLTAAGYKLQRPKGLEWMDQAVANLHGSLMGLIESNQLPREALYSEKEKLGPIAAAVRTKIHEKYSQSPQHQNWVLRDAVDRTLIAVMLKARRTGAQSPYGG